MTPWTVARQVPLSMGFSMEWVVISFFHLDSFYSSIVVLTIMQQSFTEHLSM